MGFWKTLAAMILAWSLLAGTTLAQIPGSALGDDANDLKLTRNLKWSADGAKDIGASGANRPRHIYASGDFILAGSVRASGTTDHIFGGSTAASTDGIFHFRGPNASGNSPHLSFATDADDFPQLQLVAYAHDSTGIIFDGHLDNNGGAWQSSDLGSNYRIYKTGDLLTVDYDSGVTAGSNITWNTAVAIETSGNVGMGTTNPESRLHVFAGGLFGDVIVDNDSGRGSSMSFRQGGVQRGVIGVSGKLKGDTSSNFGFFSEADIVFFRGGSSTEVGKWTATGLGLGTTAPGAPLHVNRNDTSRTDLYVENDDSAAGQEVGVLQFRGLDSGAAVQPYASVLTKINDPTAGSEDGEIHLEVASAGGLAARFSCVSNQCGVNDATPSYGLDVNGTGRYTGDLTAGADIILDAGGANKDLKATFAAVGTTFVSVDFTPDSGTQVSNTLTIEALDSPTSGKTANLILENGAGGANASVRLFSANTYNELRGSSGDNFSFTLGGTEEFRMDSGGGLVIPDAGGDPTGGGKGRGTINAKAVYDDNTLLTHWVTESWVRQQARSLPEKLLRTVGGFVARPFIADDDRRRLWTLEETREHVLENGKLPALPSRDKWEENRSLGSVVTMLLETVEQQQIQMFQMADEIRKLRKALKR